MSGRISRLLECLVEHGVWLIGVERFGGPTAHLAGRVRIVRLPVGRWPDSHQQGRHVLTAGSPAAVRIPPSAFHFRTQLETTSEGISRSQEFLAKFLEGAVFSPVKTMFRDDSGAYPVTQGLS